MTEEHDSRKDRQDTVPSFGQAGTHAKSSNSRQDSLATLPSDEPRKVAAGEVKVVKICKACMVSQAGGGGFCVKCGAELVPIRSVRDSYIGEVVGGKYKIIEQIGSGGMGEVYLGVNEPLGQRVAVKFLSRKFAADEGIILRFLNEARSYAKVSHPNAVTLLEYGQHEDGALYLITEFIEGKILTEVIKEGGAMSLGQIVGIATQCCDVLSMAHKEGVIHRDLKPDNIMLIAETRGRYAVKVLDFGIAKILDDDHHHSSHLTETGSIFGTPEFMSPEQARGEAADGRSDLYSMGIILFFLATARLPFRGKNKFAILNQQLNDAPPRPSEVREDRVISPELEKIILKSLRKQADERYQTADELAVALEGLLTGSGLAQESSALDKDDHANMRDRAAELAAAAPQDGRDALSVTLGEVGADSDDGWSDSFVGSDGTDERWESEIPGELESAREDSFSLEGGWGAIEDVPSPEHGRAASSSKKAALLALAAVLLVGSVWFVSHGFRATEPPGDNSQDQVDSLAAVDALDMESLQGVERMIDAGELEEALRSIQSLQTLLVTPEDRTRLDELIGRRQSAENLQKRVRAAVQAGQCKEAERLAETLASVSKGVRRGLESDLKSCHQPSREAGKVTKSVKVQNQPPTPAAPPPVEPPPVEPKPVEPKPPAVAAPVAVEPSSNSAVVVAPEPAQPPAVAEPEIAEQPLEELPAVHEEPLPETLEVVPEKLEEPSEGEAQQNIEDSESQPASMDAEMPDGMALPPRQL